MKKSFGQTVRLLFVVACMPHVRSDAKVDVPVHVVPDGVRSFDVLTKPPDSSLNELAVILEASQNDPEQVIRDRRSSSAIDGQFAIKLLETACYAGVVCHSAESSLRVAPLKVIHRNLRTSDLRDAVLWVRKSYESKLPIDVPGDESGKFKGMLVHSLKTRMTEYANELLEPIPRVAIQCRFLPIAVQQSPDAETIPTVPEHIAGESASR